MEWHLCQKIYQVCSTDDLHGHKQSDNNSLKQSNNNSVNNDIEINVGNQWFRVDYDGEYFPSEVLEEGKEDDFLISVICIVLERIGSGQAQMTQHFI